MTDERCRLGATARTGGRRAEALCIFEFVYFARPDAYLLGHQVHTSRRRMGELLARQSQVDADLVMGVPDSGVAGRRGLRQRVGHPLWLRAREEPLHRSHLHRAESGGRAREERAAQAQSAAREHRRAASRRRRRLDRARHDDEGARRDAARRRRDRGAPAHLLAAVHLALLLRDRHARRATNSWRRTTRSTRSTTTSARTRSSTSRSRTCARRSNSTGGAVTRASRARTRRRSPSPSARWVARW